MEVNLEILKRHLSGVLTAGACVGVLTTAYFASEESAEASAAVREKKPANVYEHLMAVLPRRKKTIASAGITIGCIVGARTIDMRTLAKMAGPYAAIGGAFSRYKNTAKRYLGEERFAELTNRFEAEEKEMYSEGEAVHWFYEPITGHFFEATWRDVWQAIDDTHKMCALDGGIKFNDFLYFIGIYPETKFKNNIGWDVGDLICEYDYAWIDIEFDERNNPENGSVDYNFNDGRITYELRYIIPPTKMGELLEMH